MTKDWPSFSGDFSSGRDFRAKKRTQLKSVIAAFNDFRLGMAYTPAYDDLKAVELHLKRAQELMSVKRWKR